MSTNEIRVKLEEMDNRNTRLEQKLDHVEGELKEMITMEIL